MSIDLSVQDKKLKIDFQDGGHLGFLIGTIIAISVKNHPAASLQISNQLAFRFRKPKIFFQYSGHLGFPIGTILASFDFQVTPMLPTQFKVRWPLV